MLTFVTFLLFFVVSLASASHHHHHVHVAKPSSQYKNLVVFGDSYSDNAHPRPSKYNYSFSVPPYYKGRQSNGIVWNEYLAQLLGAKLYNDAYSGASANNSVEFRAVPDTAAQVTELFNSTKVSLNPETTLYAYWIGINNVYDDHYVYGDNESKLVESVNSVTDQIERLLINDTKRKAKNFLLVNVPPINYLPVARNNETTTSANQLYAESETWNALLSSAVFRLQFKHPGTSFHIYDAFTFFKDVVNGPFAKQYGITNVQQPCYNHRKVCSDPSSHLFWDMWHPVTTVHEILAQSIYQMLRS